MPKYSLPSSDKILVEEGEVNQKVLLHLIKEAYNEKDLYAECEIQVKRKEDADSEIKGYYVYVRYKELWDCYRNLFQREDFHPYDKKHPFSLAKRFVRMKNNSLILKTLSEATVRHNWFASISK